MLNPTSYGIIVQAVKIVSEERISWMMCEHVVVSVPQVVGQQFVVPRFLAVQVTLIVEQLVDVPTSCFKTEPSSGLSSRSLTSQFRNSVFPLAISLADKTHHPGEINHVISMPMKQFLLPTVRCNASHHCTAALNPCASTHRWKTSNVLWSSRAEPATWLVICWHDAAGRVATIA